MPFPNFHSARVKNPNEFDPKTFRTIEIEKGVTQISGKLKNNNGKNDPMVEQTWRFDKDEFTPKQAKDWMKEHNKQYIDFEEAVDEKENDEKFDREDAEKIAEELDIVFKDFTLDEFLKGLNVELEHIATVNGDVHTIAKIALDHLAESPYYYDKLAFVEKQNNDKTKELLQWNNIPISLEWKQGDIREYKDSEHKNIMHADYGYIRNTDSQDGEELDVYLKPNSEKKTCFLISQLHPQDSTFDEFKYMLGFDTKEEAEQAYIGTMPQSMYGGINEVDWDKFITEHLAFYKNEKQNKKLVSMEKHNKFKKNEKTWARPFISCFIEPGVVSYEDSGAGIALLQKESIDSFLDTMKGRPVIIEHKENVTPNNMLDDAVGWVTEAYYEPADGKYYCKGIIFEKEALDLINAGCSVSCAYKVLDTKPGGSKNAVDYNEEITDGEYTHLALVNNPRYDSSFIKLNSKNRTVKGMILHTNNSEIRLFKNSKSELFNEEEQNNFIQKLDALTEAVQKLSDLFGSVLLVENEDAEVIEPKNESSQNNGFELLDSKINTLRTIDDSLKVKNNDSYENLKTKISQLSTKDKNIASDKKLTLKKIL